MGETDLISRQAAIDALRYAQHRFTVADEAGGFGTVKWSEYVIYFAAAERVLSELPSAQPEQQWIPCGVRLPEDFEEVNVTWINTDPEPYYDFVKGKPFTGTAVFYKGRWFWYSAVCTDYLREYGFSPNDLMDDSIKVVAWQPIPEPWKGEDDERA